MKLTLKLPFLLKELVYSQRPILADRRSDFVVLGLLLEAFKFKTPT